MSAPVYYQVTQERRENVGYSILFPFATNDTDNISQEGTESKLQFLSTLLF
jgi:hypothetical protein